jgi:thioredoxin-like negative regulator of GroEL
MSESSDAAVLVACLCAAWCRTCDDYRVVFERMRAEFAGQARFVWVDIEDDEAVLGELDIEDFPTLALARGDRIAFFGPVMPHLQTARQLIDRALRDELPPVDDRALSGLPARLRVLARG